jgi:cytochrome c biogenesis factor
MNFLDKVGGAFNAVLCAALMAGTMALIYLGKVSPEVGFGFITASLVPLALGHQANMNHQKQLKAAEDVKLHQVEIGLGVAKQANENHRELLDKMGAKKK